MTHIAIQESVGGKNVDWMEKVSEFRNGSIPRITAPQHCRPVLPNQQTLAGRLGMPLLCHYRK
jgi:hypothetical protein